MELIPAIDMRNEQVVRLRQGDFRTETRYRKTPEQLLRQYRRVGARRVHLVDLEAARVGKAGDAKLLRALAENSSVKIQIGGGVRRSDDVARFLDAGADRVVAGSVAVHSPAKVAEWIRRFGQERIVAALDVRIGNDGTPRLATHGWQQTTQLSLWSVVARLERDGLMHALCTDIARDGTKTGPNVELYRECALRFPHMAWQASGGVRDATDLHALAVVRVNAAIVGKALIESDIPKRELSPFLPAA